MSPPDQSDSLHSDSLERVTVELVESPIEIADWTNRFDGIDSGAHAWFAGVTRRKTKTGSGDIRVTRTLHYQAHRSMALDQLRRLARAAAEQHTLSHVVVVHRLGEVPLGEASVLVGCCSAHRANAFAALPWIMDQLKADVPIWKRETYEDDSTEWIHP